MTMDKESEEELEKILAERRKWENFFEILCRRYIYFPLILLLVYLIDDSNINIVAQIGKIVQKLFGGPL